MAPPQSPPAFLHQFLAPHHQHQYQTAKIKNVFVNLILNKFSRSAPLPKMLCWKLKVGTQHFYRCHKNSEVTMTDI
jgi:hypothetical protein